MTASTIDLSEYQPEPVGIPDHTVRTGPIPAASSGEDGAGTKRPGIFGAATRKRSPKLAAKPKATREAPPKLSAGMKGQLEDLYSGIGAMLRPFDEFTGQTIIDQAPKCAKSVYDLAQTNDSVRRFVIAMTTTSATGAVIFAHLPIVLALMRHSSNERVKAGAGMAFMGLKMADDETMEKMFGQKPEADGPEVPVSE
jgi:hypothetical protein